MHPDLRRIYRFVPNPPIRFGPLLALMQAGSRLTLRPPILGGLGYRLIQLGSGAAIHLFTPAGERVRPALLWIHGGGMVSGSAAQDYARCMSLARDLDIVVASTRYRLAPGNPYPAPLDDCYAAWQEITTHADALGVDVSRVVVGGQSAGGGLAAALAQRIHDAGGTQPAGQWLFCPMLDDRTAADRSLDEGRHFLWNNSSNLIGWTAYLGTAPGAAETPPYAAPARRSDLRGLPPAWIGTGDADLFYAENRQYADRLRAAGVPCVLDAVPGGPHAFESIAFWTPVARAYYERALVWLRAALGVSPGPAGYR